MCWSTEEVDFVELLKVYLSIKEQFSLHEIYVIKKQ